MGPRLGQSPWVHRLPAGRRRRFPPLRGEATADVAVIGGGLTGCAVAHAVAMSGLTVCLLEAGKVGTGGTASSLGLLLPEPGPAFRDLSAGYGAGAARQIVETWRRATLDAAAQVRRLGVSCALRPVEDIAAGRDPEDRSLVREAEARTAAGLDVTVLGPRKLKGLLNTGFVSGFRQQGGFALDPYRACLGLARAVRARGGVVCESSAVVKVRSQRDGVAIELERGVLHAGRVVVATGEPTRLFPSLRRHFSSRNTTAVLTEVMPVALRRQVAPASITFRDAHDPPHRVAVTDDHRLLVAGAEQDDVPARAREAHTRQWTFELMYELSTMFPVMTGLQPAYGWRHVTATTRDGLPFIGPHRNFPHHFFALGGSGHSLTGAFLAARVLVRALRDQADKSDRLFGFTR